MYILCSCKSIHIYTSIYVHDGWPVGIEGLTDGWPVGFEGWLDGWPVGLVGEEEGWPVHK
jgi:hypothetical protein